MVKKAIQTIERHNMLCVSDVVIVGLSGGADSVALFHLLLEIREKYKLTVVAVHVNHGLRGAEADGDESFCVRLCQKRGVPIEIYKYDIKQISADSGKSEEEAGRKMRYEAFYAAQKKHNAQKIAVAHNRNDQAETVFLRLFRGAGLKGLSGIAPVRDCIIRPLLDVSREEIEAYCTQNELSYRTDSTNKTDCYSRNIVRNRIIPIVRESFNPSIVQTLAQTAEIIRLEDDYLDLLAYEAYEKCVSDNGESLNIKIFSAFDEVIKRRALRIAYLKLDNSLADIELNHVDKILSLLHMQSGKKAVVGKGIVAKRQFDKLILRYTEREALDFSYDLELGCDIYIKEADLWVTVSHIELKNKNNRNNIYTKCFCYDKIIHGLKLRTRLPKDKIRISNVGTKKMKDYLIGKKIEPARRNAFFYLADGDNIIWIIGDNAPNDPKLSTESDGNKFYVQLWEVLK